MSYQMEFSETFDEFAEAFGFKDSEKIYTNGSELIPVFRVRQWLEHDNKLRTIETDTAYECDKHTNTWIPVSERLPEENGFYLATYIFKKGKPFTSLAEYENGEWVDEAEDYICILAWMPLPEPYKAGNKTEQGLTYADQDTMMPAT